MLGLLGRFNPKSMFRYRLIWCTFSAVAILNTNESGVSPHRTQWHIIWDYIINLRSSKFSEIGIAIRVIAGTVLYYRQRIFHYLQPSRRRAQCIDEHGARLRAVECPIHSQPYGMLAH